MNGVIIYKSKYGSTRQYSEWLRDETGFDIYTVNDCPVDLSKYDTIVIGSYVRAGRLSLAGFIRNKWFVLKNKNVIIMLVNMTDDQKALQKIVPSSLSSDIVNNVKVFPVSGKYTVSSMSFLDRTIIKMAASIEKREDIKKQLLTDRNLTNKENLNDLIKYIQLHVSR